MAKAIQDPKAIFQEITSGYRDVFGDDLISIILYGSATGRDYRPGQSDINFMIVLSEDGIEQLDRAFAVVEKWRKRQVAVPLFLTEHYVETSLDVFPIEYLNFKRHHVPVYGKDILSVLIFEPEHIRLQCEREIKGKLLLLRGAFLETGGKGKSLGEVISRSIPTFVAIFEALLFLKEKEIPEIRRDMIKAGCETYGLEADLFSRLSDVKEEKVKMNDMEMRSLFKGYLKEVKKLYRIVDQMGG